MDLTGWQIKMNRSKDMIFCELWLTKAEFQMIVISLRGRLAVALVGTILKKAYKRGDFQKK